ncbi:carbonic anhydrase 9 [Paroedura picta]|uniref:carbonic anhydrase 9 n=1 Tax=Paroedura picta TaxID=143630 RepID=UPI004056378A
MRSPWLLALLLVLRCRASEDSHAAGPPPPGHGPRHWSYADKAEWASDFPNCGGHMQSPIDIDTATTVFSPQLKPLKLLGYSLTPEEKLSLRNNGHTIVLGLPANMSVSGGGFPQAYLAAQLHLHWGSQAGPGSEHTVNGHRYAGEITAEEISPDCSLEGQILKMKLKCFGHLMRRKDSLEKSLMLGAIEGKRRRGRQRMRWLDGVTEAIHVVHYNPHFGGIREAAREPGGLAVLAAFLQAGSEENEAYQHILDILGEVHEEGEEASIAGFDIAKLLPDDLHSYFRYNGSLTTPPCYQTVNWTIFNQTILLSEEQIAVLEESLLGEMEELIQGNFRLSQGLHGRTVLASFLMPPPAPPVAEPPDAGQQANSSFHTGDLLAILFGTLFAVTTIAFLLYVCKQRTQRPRLDAQAAKPSVIYVAATTEEPAGEETGQSS